MAEIFFPGCKVSAGWPEQSAKLQKYLLQRYGIEATGCCRINRIKLTADDIAVAICNNCAAILRESSYAKQVISVWELIDQDKAFAFPDYGGKHIYVQECWMTEESHQVAAAVRSLLKKMNFILEETEKVEPFCGNLLKPILPDNKRLAPLQYGNRCAELLQPFQEAERIDYLKNYSRRYHGQITACYCKACHQALRDGGVRAVHLLELLFV